VQPDTVDAEGEFVHTDRDGNVIGQGTWTATGLLTYQGYGCGILAFTDPPTPLRPDWCGGRVFMRVLYPGTIEVFCIIGPNPPNNHDDPSGEGVVENVPGIIHFNRIVFGDNLYIQTS